jgi:hypothetical protein
VEKSFSDINRKNKPLVCTNFNRYVQIAQKAGKFNGVYTKRINYSRMELNQIGHD